MINKKIQAITNLISSSNILIDVGCDHCFLAIELFKQNKIKHIINVDINKKPLDSGVKNLIKYNLLNKTTNIVNDGLKDIEKKDKIFQNITKIDYCVIAGMGSSSIIDIIKNNQLNIQNYILQSSKDEWKLRKYLINNNYEIISETYVFDNDIFYPIFFVKKNNIIYQYSQQDIFFGKIEIIVNKDLYIQMLKTREKFFENLFTKYEYKKMNDDIKDEYNALKERIKLMI